MIVFGFLILTVVFFYSIFRGVKNKEIINPNVIFNVIVWGAYSTYFVFFSPEYILSTTTVLLLVFCTLAFNTAKYLVYYINTRTAFSNKLVHFEERYFLRKVNKLVLYVFLSIGIIGFVYGIFYAIKLGNMPYYPDGNFFQNLRENFVRMNNPFLIKYSKYFLTLAVSAILLEHYMFNKYSKKYIAALITIVVIQSFLQLARTDMLIMLLPLIYIYLTYGIESQKNSTSKNKLIKVFGIFSILLLFSIFIAVISLRTTSFNIFSKEFFLYEYIARPLITFDQHVVMHPGISNGIHVFEPITKVLLALNIPLSYDTIALPLGTFNVFSALGRPYMDFGFFGTIITFFAIGSFTHFSFEMSKKNSYIFKLFFPLYLYPIFMVFFVWQFTIITYVYFSIMIFLLYFDYSKLKKIKQGGN